MNLMLRSMLVEMSVGTKCPFDRAREPIYQLVTAPLDFFFKANSAMSMLVTGWASSRYLRWLTSS